MEVPVMRQETQLMATGFADGGSGLGAKECSESFQKLDPPLNLPDRNTTLMTPCRSLWETRVALLTHTADTQ